MTDDDRAKFSRESVAMKLYISADANAALRAASARTTWSMSTIIDMLIKAHAPMMGVSPGLAEAVRQYESPEEAYKNAVVDCRTTMHEPPEAAAQRAKRAALDRGVAEVKKLLENSKRKDFDFDAE